MIGSIAVASPDLAAKLFQLNAGANPQLGFMSRMFGSREIALGAITLMAKGTARRKLVGLGIAVDATDAFAAVDAMRSGSVSRSTGLGLALPAVGAMAAGASGLVKN